MATLIFVDKENSRVASKDGLKLGSGLGKALDGKTSALDGKTSASVPLAGKKFDAAPAFPKAARKALGTVNRATEKEVKANVPLKPKQASVAKKMTEKKVKAKTSVPAPGDTYPEIEKFFPFNPIDFESFDLPEEHQIASLTFLKGVPLLILNKKRELYRLLELGPPSPVKMPSPPWESGLLPSPSSILSTLNVELPPVCYDMEI